jgi:hypothetical protein
VDIGPDIKIVVGSDNLDASGIRVFVNGQELKGVLSVKPATVIDRDGPIETEITLRLIGRRVLIENADAATSPEERSPASNPFAWASLWNIGR